MPSEILYLVHALQPLSLFTLGWTGGRPNRFQDSPERTRLQRPQSLSGFLQVMRRETNADAAYLLRADGRGTYVPFVSQGPAIPSIPLPELLVPMQVPLPIGEREPLASAIPLESSSFGHLLLLLVHEQRPSVRARELGSLAEKAIFLFTLVENQLLVRQSRSIIENLSYLSTIALSGELNEEDLCHMLAESLRNLLGAEDFCHVRLRKGNIETVTVSDSADFPLIEDLFKELGERSVAATSSGLLLARASFSDRTDFFVFRAEMAKTFVGTVEQLIRTAEQTYQRHRSDQGVRESIQRVAALYALERELSEDSDPDHILRRTLEELAIASSAPALSLISVEDDACTLLAEMGFDQEASEELLEQPDLNRQIFVTAAERSPRAFFLRDLPEAVQEAARKANLQTIVLLPLHLGGETIGVALLGFQEECVLEESLLEHVNALATIGMQAFSRQKLSLERQEILQSYRSLAIITDVTLSDLPMEELLTTLAERLYDVLTPDSVVIFLASRPRDQYLKPVAVEGLLSHLGEDDLLLPVEQAAKALHRPYTIFEPMDQAPPALRHIYGRVVASPIEARSRLVGVVRLDFPLGRRLSEPELNLLQLASERLSYVLEMRELIQSYQDLYISSILSLAGAVDAKDPYTRNHSEQVSRYARAIAEAMQLPEDQVEEISTAGLLHDVGKIAIPDAILNKPEPLTPEEFEIVKSHTDHGARIVEQGPALRHLGPIIRYHHERPDGQGYYRLKDAEAPLGSYIIAVADAFDTMTTDRPYRRALTLREAKAELIRNRGTQFLPSVVDSFTALLESGRLPLRGGS